MVGFPLPWLINRGFLQMSLLAAEVQYIPELRSELFNCLVYPELWISRLDRWHLSQTCNHVWWGRAEVEDNIYSYIFRSHSTGEHTGSIPFNSVLRCVKWRFHPKQAGLPSNKFMGCWPERTSKTKNGNNCWHPKISNIFPKITMRGRKKRMFFKFVHFVSDLLFYGCSPFFHRFSCVVQCFSMVFQ